MVLVQKWPFFQLFYFRQYRPRGCVLRYSTSKKWISRLKKEKFKKSKDWDYSKGVNRWFWSKNGYFFTLLFRPNIGQEIVFYDIQEQKNNFLGCKNKKIKKWKKNCLLAIFPVFFRQYRPGKCVLWYSNPWFWSKNGHFSISFFLSNIGQQSVFYNILRQKITNF